MVLTIRITGADEIKSHWIKVKNRIIDEVLQRQSTKVDLVTGATESSRGLLEAIENARKKSYKGD